MPDPLKSAATKLLVEHKSANPHQLLGLHVQNGQKAIRIWKPGAKEIFLEVFGEIKQTTKTLEEGLFEFFASPSLKKTDYRIYHQNGFLAHDPYAFDILASPCDIEKFQKGIHYELYSFLGAHPVSHQGVTGMVFRVWAPNARSVSLIGDFNHWDGRISPMRNVFLSGIWELFVPGMQFGERYKFEIHPTNGFLRMVKSDPFAFYQEKRPLSASITFDLHKFSWSDQTYEKKKKKSLERPINIYEVHLGSWKKNGEEFLNYRELAHLLVPYCKEMNFTHIELLPIMEHPLDESWGYQVTGFFATTSRFGTPEDFQYFVNYFHENDLGVILDWVPAHFPTDDFSLYHFDGTCLFEHHDPQQRKHPHWNTHVFNYGRKEISNFLLASSLFFLSEMHIDGLRVDAVASMLYLDYGRNSGEWTPNRLGGNHNLEALDFLKHLNSILHQKHPKALIIAEESSVFPKVSFPLDQGGIGFDMKWNMGWMHDLLNYLKYDPLFRKHYHSQFLFSFSYAFTERFLLPFSHDEVVHGKKSLLGKMPGPPLFQFASLRLLYSCMICHPGKKLLFMGNEFASEKEWNCKSELEWHLLSSPLHQKMKTFVSALNRFYLNRKELWEFDFSPQGYQWIGCSDELHSILSYLRKSSKSVLLCAHNCTPVLREHYWVDLPHIPISIKEVFNSDAEEYGGLNHKNARIPLSKEKGVFLDLAPLATMIFEVKFEKTSHKNTARLH